MMMVHYLLFGTDDRICVDGWFEGVTDPSVWRVQRSDSPVILWDEEQAGPEGSANMLNLVALAPVLERVYARRRFTLVVLGASRKRWQLLNRSFAFDSEYIRVSKWKRQFLLKRANLVLQPCKLRSRNSQFGLRAKFEPRHARREGLLESRSVPHLRESESSDRFEQLIFRALDSNKMSNYEETGRDDDSESAPSESAGQQWSNLLEAESIGHLSPLNEVTGQERLLVTINLLQDVPIALRVVDLAISKKIDVSVLVGAQAVENGSLILRDLGARAIPIRFMGVDEDSLADPRWLEDATMLFCPSESSAAAHSSAHRLTSTANLYGVRTFTVQNGFEQAGITFQDPDVGVVHFEANTIFTWQSRSKSPLFISDAVRSKCVGVGRFTPQPFRSVKNLSEFGIDHFDVAIFENLHWGRYDQAYRDAFIEWCSRIAADFPNYRFLLQPHPAGRWMERYRSGKPSPENLTVTEYEGRATDFERTASILASVTRVISSPSTILVDAAEAGCAVAVAAHGVVEGADYSPILSLRSYEDWKEFLSADIGQHFYSANQVFLDRVRMPSQPDELIFEIMLNQTYAGQPQSML
ncbi:MAG: hypothetical protein AAF437_03725 [Pseudomonadota bacterium]